MIIFWKKLFFVLCLSCVLLLNASFVLALEVTYPSLNVFGQSFSVNDTSTVSDYFCYLFGLATNLAILAAVIVIALGGIFYLVSYGRGKFTSDAKEWIKAGVTGLLIVVCATLIAYTINPNLTTCNVGILSFIKLTSSTGSTTTSTVPVSTYKEIPIGTLTEILLTRTINCYGFDQNGDPIDGDTSTSNILEPTYTDHDRADCLTQLVEGAQKKAQVIASLSQEITKLMNKCDCKKYGSCEPASGSQCTQPASCPGQCTGGGACQSPTGNNAPPDCCPTTSGVKDPLTGSELSVKDLIEHGPISVSVDTGTSVASGQDCKAGAKDYKGLDEFRCTTNCTGSELTTYVEKQTQVGSSTVTSIIDIKKWNKLTLIQQLTYLKEKIDDWAVDSQIISDKNNLDNAKTALGKCYWAMPYVDLVKTYENANKNNKIILTAPETFVDPLTSKKIDASKYCTGFNYDNSSCLKKCSDMCPDTSNAAVQLYKQCKECSATDSACLSTQQACIKNAYNQRPCVYGDNTSQTFSQCISSCQNNCVGSCTQKYAVCSNEYDFCQSQCANNGQCVLDNSSQCLFGSQQFQQCANNVTDQGNTNYCINNAYLCKNGSDEYAGYPDCAEPIATNCLSFTTQKTCDNSNSSGTKKAGEKCSANSDCSSNLICDTKTRTCKTSPCVWDGKKCWENYSSSFFYGNPLYQKCLWPAAEPACRLDTSTGQADSACQAKTKLVGHAPYCQPTNSKVYINQSCEFTCTETAKCPSASTKCGACPCDQINKTLGFSVPNRSSPGHAITCKSSSECSIDETCSSGLCKSTTETTVACAIDSQCSPGICSQGICVPQSNNGAEGYVTQAKKISDYQMVGPQCNGYSYNDDPLTFYCQDSWWTAPVDPGREGLSSTPVGTNRICPKTGAAGFSIKPNNPTGEIPVGQTVDDAEAWANKLINSISSNTTSASYSTSPNFLKNGGDIDKDIKTIIDLMEKIGKAKDTDPIKNYCKCGAQNKNSKPICKTGCQYWEATDSASGQLLCGCNFSSCTGNPCEQITDYLSQLWNNYRKFKLDATDFSTTMLAEPRSDIMKELAYSRKTTSSCSLIDTTHNAQDIMLSCTRVKDEIVAPVNKGYVLFKGQELFDGSKVTWTGESKDVGCYGQDLGSQSGQALTDNWFCCQEFSSFGGGSSGGNGASGSY